MLHYKTNDKTNDELSIQYPNCKKKKISNSYVKNTNKNAKIQQQINKQTTTKVKN